jgi:hypothetical protein
MAREMSGDMNAALSGVAWAYRDMEAVEAMHAEHDRRHAEAEAKGEHYDCREYTHDFWDNLGTDVAESGNITQQATYKVVIARLLMERKVRSGEVGFIVVEPPQPGETEDDWIARVRQAIQDDDDLRAMESDQDHGKDMVDKFEQFLRGAGVSDATFEMPTGDENDDDQPETKIGDDTHE